jgi:hypothetical protein
MQQETRSKSKVSKQKQSNRRQFNYEAKGGGENAKKRREGVWVGGVDPDGGTPGGSAQRM